jgi:hypothetical protein
MEDIRTRSVCAPSVLRVGSEFEARADVLGLACDALPPVPGHPRHQVAFQRVPEMGRCMCLAALK